MILQGPHLSNSSIALPRPNNILFKKD
ncbi:uncharacterized protein METZ01_LOCUS446008 [marine metagenome]|uniref:Uncharacterized protein n=1 Tax=marine metagenome TaxID=408172 RepID=A0A382ZCD0_9ZZZZ